MEKLFSFKLEIKYLILKKEKRETKNLSLLFDFMLFVHLQILRLLRYKL